MKAEGIYKEKYEEVAVMQECTYCYEVIYPQNKIVVDYANDEDLYLISIKHTKTGKNVNIEQSGFKTVKKINTNGISFNEWLCHDVPNEEGYVMKFTKDNLLVKIKFDNYVDKHKGKYMRKENIEKSMKNMIPINLSNIPDECYDDVKIIVTKMELKFKEKEIECMREYLYILEHWGVINRTDMIEAMKQSNSSAILFAMHANKRYDKLIWKML